MKPIAATALIDQYPGHRKQTEAIIRSLSDYTRINTHYRHVACDLKSDLRNWTKALTAWAGSDRTKPGESDIVIGTGSHTHAAVIRLGIIHGARKIICMSPLPGLGFLFDLCFVPEHDRPAQSEKIFITAGPPNLSKNLNRHEPDQGLILIGGTDPGSHCWRSSAVLEAVLQIIARTPGIKWTISTSPRTPQSMEQAVLRLFHSPRVEVVLFSQAPAGWIEKQYSACRFVWVTADSMNMIYEAITAGCSVGLIPVEWKKRAYNKFEASNRRLIDRGYAISYQAWLNGERFPCPGKTLNEADRCAKEILRRWWPEKLR